jgi:UDP-glucose:glycoprotein glucosyltransferase
MDVPNAWLVRPKEAVYDLDNIQLTQLSSEHTVTGVEAIFDLSFIVIEGHARESVNSQPPRGLQLELLDGAGHAIDDTQVVANLGYLQFKALPGVFQLHIREGRGRDIYRLESVGGNGWDSKTVEEIGDEIAVTSFEGLTLYPRMGRLPGMEVEDVLAGPDQESSGSKIINSAWSMCVPCGSFLI